MDNSTPNPLNQLDGARNDRGPDGLCIYFRVLVSENRNEALRLLNDESLLFASLFTLKDELSKLGLQGYLNSRNCCSLLFAEKVLNGKTTRMIWKNQQLRTKLQNSLRWIVESGSERINHRFDDVVDAAAIILLKTYKDKTAIPPVSNTIFERNRNEGYTYDLIWALFESSDPEVLLNISERLASSNPIDAELAQKLLNFIPNEGSIGSRENEQKINWIRENYNFLYYTGETQHQSCNPEPFAISREAKYICKPVSPETGDFHEPLLRKEHKALTHFSALDDYTKELLSDYSAKLRLDDQGKWSQWLDSPLSEQIIHVARSRGGIL